MNQYSKYLSKSQELGIEPRIFWWGLTSILLGDLSFWVHLCICHPWYHPLAILNVSAVSRGLFIGGIFVGKKRDVVTILEVLIHAVACIGLLGWSTGFQLYLFCMPFVTYVSPWFSKQTKGWLTVLYALMFMFLAFLFSEAPLPIPWTHGYKEHFYLEHRSYFSLHRSDLLLL